MRLEPPGQLVREKFTSVLSKLWRFGVISTATKTEYEPVRVGSDMLMSETENLWFRETT